MRSARTTFRSRITSEFPTVSEKKCARTVLRLEQKTIFLIKLKDMVPRYISLLEIGIRPEPSEKQPVRVALMERWLSWLTSPNMTAAMVPRSAVTRRRSNLHHASLKKSFAPNAQYLRP